MEGAGEQRQRRSTGARACDPGRLTCPWCQCSRDGPGSGSPCAGSPSGYSWPAPCRSAGRGTEWRWSCVAGRCLPALPGPLSSPHTHRPLGDVVGPDVGTTRGRLLTGSGSRRWRGQNVGPRHPQLATPPGPHPSRPRPPASTQPTTPTSSTPTGGTNDMTLSLISESSAVGTWGPGCTRPQKSASGPDQTCPWGALYHPAT